MLTHYTRAPFTHFGEWKKRASQAALFDRFLPHFQADAKVLEIGPGESHFAEQCHAHGIGYVGLEPSEPLRKRLEAAGFDVRPQAVPPIPFENAHFDLVHSRDFVEHLPGGREVVQFFDESFRVLKPGGHVSVVAPNYSTTGKLFYEYEYQHSYVTTPGRLLNLLHDSGFEIVDIRCFLFSMSRWWTWLDRLVVYLFVPLWLSSPVRGLARALLDARTVFRVDKNLTDHFAILARKTA
ncbi:MAG: class I SAM-dependent methyltransferase [Acidobacteriota bacterium]